MHRFSVGLFALLGLVIAFILVTHKARAPFVVPVPEVVSPVVTPEVPASKDDLITLESPLPKSLITSPLVVKGKARGTWFFEGSFPIEMVNWDGLIIGEGYATAQGEWMTTEYVPFEGTITFTRPQDEYSDKGWIILKKDNPSDNPALDNALEVEIQYK